MLEIKKVEEPRKNLKNSNVGAEYSSSSHNNRNNSTIGAASGISEYSCIYVSLHLFEFFQHTKLKKKYFFCKSKKTKFIKKRSPEMSAKIGIMEYQMKDILPYSNDLKELNEDFNDDLKNEEELIETEINQERCRLSAGDKAIPRAPLVAKPKIRLNKFFAVDKQLRANKTKLMSELSREIFSNFREIAKFYSETIELKRQHIRELFSKLKTAEDAVKSGFEKTANLQSEINELKRQLAEKDAYLDRCKNCYDEMRKVEQLIEEIRIERDELRSALNKIPKCVICLDKRPQKLYMPCLHFVCCDECGNELEQCPICRQKICGKITVYQ